MKKSMAKVLASALSLAMAVTLVTPTDAAAASAPKFVKTYGKLYSNAVYSVKNVKKGYKVKVSVSGTAKSAVTPTKKGKKVSTIKATGSTVKFTAAVKASEATAGKGATVKVVVYNTKGKKVKTLSDGIRVMAHTTAVSVSAAATKTAINQPVDLTATLTPSYATDEVSYTVDPADGASVTDGKFVATKEGTYKVTATSNGRTSEPVEIVVTNGITGVSQTAADSIRVTFAADASKTVTKENLTVKAKDSSATDIAVKEVKFSEDGKAADVTLLTNLKDGVAYDVTANGTSAELKASVGKVAKIAFETASAEVNTETDVKFRLFDANGIDVTSTVNVDSTCFMTVEGDNTNAVIETPSKATITFSEVGKKATVKVTYNSGEKDAADVVGEQEIVCTAATAKTGNSVFTTNKDTGVSKNSQCAKFYLGLADTNVTVTKNGSDAHVYFYAKDTNGKAINYDSYEVESSNDNVVSANATKANGKYAIIDVTGTEKGSATLSVKAEKNGVASYYTIPVTVKEKGKAVKLTLTQTKSTMSNADDKDYYNEFEAKLYDADGNELTTDDDNATFEFTNSAEEAGKDDLVVDTTVTGNKYRVYAFKVNKNSSYTVKVKASDAEGTTIPRALSFSVRTLPEEYKSVTYSAEVSEKTLDVSPQIKKDDRKETTKVRLYATVNNLFAGYVGGKVASGSSLTGGTSTETNDITVFKDDGTTAKSASEMHKGLAPDSALVVSTAAVSVKFGQTVDTDGDLVNPNKGTAKDIVSEGAVTFDAVHEVNNGETVNAFVKNTAFDKTTAASITSMYTEAGKSMNAVAGFAKTGSYSVAVDVVYADKADHKKTYSTSFTVKNSMVLPTVSVSKSSVSSDIVSEALTTNVDLNNDNNEYESIIGLLDNSGKEPEMNNNKMIVKYAVVEENYNDVTYNFLVPIGKTFTFR